MIRLMVKLLVFFNQDQSCASNSQHSWRLDSVLEELISDVLVEVGIGNCGQGGQAEPNRGRKQSVLQLSSVFGSSDLVEVVVPK